MAHPVSDSHFYRQAVWRTVSYIHRVVQISHPATTCIWHHARMRNLRVAVPTQQKAHQIGDLPAARLHLLYNVRHFSCGLGDLV